MSGKAIVTPGGKRGVLPGGKVGVTDSSGACPPCGCEGGGGGNPCSQNCVCEEGQFSFDIIFEGAMGTDLGMLSLTATSRVTNADGCTFYFASGPIVSLQFKMNGGRCDLYCGGIRTVTGATTYAPFNNPNNQVIGTGISLPGSIGPLPDNLVSWSPNGSTEYGIQTLDVYCNP